MLSHRKHHPDHTLSPAVFRKFLPLGPLLCILYTTPLSSIIKASSVNYYLYADDTQLLMSFSQISSWMTSSLLCLNPSKTEFILIGLREELKKIPDLSISLNLDSASTPNSPVRSLGLSLDQNLSFSDHITNLSAPTCTSCISATFEESALRSITKLHLPSIRQ